MSAKNEIRTNTRKLARLCSKKGEDDDDFERNFSFWRGKRLGGYFCIDFDRSRRSGVVAFVDGGGPRTARSFFSSVRVGQQK